METFAKILSELSWKYFKSNFNKFWLYGIQKTELQEIENYHIDFKVSELVQMTRLMVSLNMW